MSSELSMFSDDDTPLGVMADHSNGTSSANGHVNGNGNHAVNGIADADSSMSEDETPLVSDLWQRMWRACVKPLTTWFMLCF
jgi:phage gp45-like